ncbi:SEC14-like protein 2 isoform X1 [Folsomia candida]|uniref:SEC14-like protein 2 isoform X1 n=1 Tax=Folsomia candida TaxID=158441 RepID=UPI0016052D06|nr:SEC14-like protein 2 isoform X1 [Folsomia candida]XP_035715564.1 SEC14-like protein 2 isoform X1 [Folsomia candida]
MFPRVLLVFFLLSEISAHGIDEDLVITWEQKEKLDEFRTIMEPHLPHDYMKTDIYLIRWLKARNYEIPAASRMLQENLWWREENEMDALLDEDWTEFNNQYRFNLDGCDGNGAPVFVLFAGEWDMRRAALAGQSEKMRRYIDKCFEEASTVLRNMQARGSNATRANLILDLGSLSFQVQACPRCIPFYLYLVQSLGAHFPNVINACIVINTPEFAVPLWNNMIKPVAPPEVRKLVDVYGRKRSEWREALLTKYGIDFTKMSHEMGGDGRDPVDSNDLRKSDYLYECPELK